MEETENVIRDIRPKLQATYDKVVEMKSEFYDKDSGILQYEVSEDDAKLLDKMNKAIKDSEIYCNDNSQMANK